MGIAFFSFFNLVSLAESIPVPEDKYLRDVQLIPQKLKLEGDSVRFVVKGTIPIESVLAPKNPKINILFKSSTEVLDLGELELVKSVANYSYEKEFSLRYQSWMQDASVEVHFFQGKKAGSTPSETRILSKGIIAPQLMVKLGEVYPDEPIPVIGMYINSGVLDKEMVQTKEFVIRFDPGSAEYVNSPANSKTLDQLDDFISKNPEVVEVRITGLQSPESEEGKSNSLGMARAQAAQKKLNPRMGSNSTLMIKVGSRFNDWFDLRLLLRDYRGVSTNRKDELYTILMSQESYQEQTEKLKKVSGFSQVAQDLYPLLRVAKIEITAKPRIGLDIQQSIRLKEALAPGGKASDLSFAEWVLAAESTQSLQEKAVIYAKMTEYFRSALPYNNMAVVRIRQAQRTLDRESQEVLWEEANRLLEQANRIQPNPQSFHNQGQIMALRGQYWEAYLKLSEAASMSQSPDFLKQNEPLRGALDILRGDYKLATLRFDYPFTDPKDYFNKGLAFYLVGDYSQANLAFEESVVNGREFGYGYYGLAMIAAGSGQNETAVIQLKKAIQANSQLADKAYADPIFEEFRKNEAFFSELFSK